MESDEGDDMVQQKTMKQQPTANGDVATGQRNSHNPTGQNLSEYGCGDRDPHLDCSTEKDWPQDGLQAANATPSHCTDSCGTRATTDTDVQTTSTGANLPDRGAPKMKESRVLYTNTSPHLSGGEARLSGPSNDDNNNLVGAGARWYSGDPLPDAGPMPFRRKRSVPQSVSWANDEYWTNWNGWGDIIR